LQARGAVLQSVIVSCDALAARDVRGSHLPLLRAHGDDVNLDLALLDGGALVDGHARERLQDNGRGGGRGGRLAEESRCGGGGGGGLAEGAGGRLLRDDGPQGVAVVGARQQLDLRARADGQSVFSLNKVRFNAALSGALTSSGTPFLMKSAPNVASRKPLYSWVRAGSSAAGT
jgi:hypothetical protein